MWWHTVDCVWNVTARRRLRFEMWWHNVDCVWNEMAHCRLRLKCDGTLAETRFGLSVKRTSPFKSAGGRQFSRLLVAEMCASAVVMLDTPCSEVVWRVLANHSIRQFPLHFPSRASPCAITFQLWSTPLLKTEQPNATAQRGRSLWHSVPCLSDHTASWQLHTNTSSYFNEFASSVGLEIGRISRNHPPPPWQANGLVLKLVLMKF